MITLEEYNDEIKAIAAGCAKEAEGDHDRALDLVHEAVDGHEWIIYTHHNAEVLQHSDNHEAYFDDCGQLEADSYSDAMIKMAFAAMHRDVCDEIEGALAAYSEEA